MKDFTEELIQTLDSRQQELADLSREIWEYAELSEEEHRSSRRLAAYLKENGFAVEEGVCGLPTAFCAKWGSGNPVISFLGEYDALPGLSQKALPEQAPVRAGAPGHACGHNLLGSGMAGSAAAVRGLLERYRLPGTVQYFGCPAEEIMLGKIVMAKQGAFDSSDVCLTWHPMASNTVSDYSYSAMTSMKFTFLGKTAHAAAAPEQGRSALDAVELMNVGANYLREHIIPQARVHYVITDGGGKPNVVPGRAQSWYYVRAPYKEQVEEITKRLIDVSNGAALMTGTTVMHEVLSGCSNNILNGPLNRLLYESMTRVPVPDWTQEELEFAKKLQDTFPDQVRRNALLEFSVMELEGQILHSGVTPLKAAPAFLAGSTDVSDVSAAVPTGQVFTCCMPVGTPGHTWQVAACAGMSIGQKGMLYAAKVIADTAMRLFCMPELLAEIKADFKQTGGRNGGSE